MLYTESAQLIRSYVPRLTTRERGVCLVLPTPSRSRAEYLGKIGGTHYVVHFPTSKYLDAKTASLEGQLDIAHELVHQKQAEVLGQSRFWGFNYEDKIANNTDLSLPDFYNPQAVEDWVNKVKSEGNKIIGGQGSSVLLYLAEGMASAAEYRILLQMVRHGERTNEAKVLYRRYKGLERKYYNSPEDWSYLATYQRGLSVFRKLSSKLTEEELAEFMLTVDIEACLEIKLGSRKSIDILQDPFLIPRINR